MSNTMTPYAASKIANKALEDAGVEKKLPPQMFYTYVNKGYIESKKVDGKARVTSAQLNKWLQGYIETQLAKSRAELETHNPEVDVDQLEIDFEDTDES
jgi:hypothetical protein